MNNSLQKVVRTLWDKLPEGTYKEKMRVIRYNCLSRGAARFSLRGGIFSVQVGAMVFWTVDHPFGVAREHYQAKYKVKEGDIVIDAGAYNGHLSLLFALRAGPSGRVIAIEPDERNIALMQRNFLLNRLFAMLRW